MKLAGISPPLGGPLRQPAGRSLFRNNDIVPNFPAVVRGENWMRREAFDRDDELGHERARDKCNVGM